MRTLLWMAGRPVAAFIAGAVAYCASGGPGPFCCASPDPVAQVFFLAVFAWTLHGHPEVLARSLYHRTVVLLGQGSSRPGPVSALHVSMTSATSDTTEPRSAGDSPAHDV